MKWSAVNKKSGEVLCSEVKKADTYLLRLKGLMGRKKMGMEEGLFLEKVSSIHTCFMKITIDVIYLDREYHVIYKETVPPWRIGKVLRKTAHVLELHEGAREKFELNTQIDICNAIARQQ